MTPYMNYILPFFMTIIFCSCGQQNNETDDNGHTVEQNTQLDNIKNSESGRKDYELADEFLLKIRNDKADTVIFFKRTCINCCDFYNIFWSAKGQSYLTKFYFDFDDMKTHTITIPLKTNKIFKVLGNNYHELKNTSIKENSHKRKDGITSLSMMDHYCYAQLIIYFAQDSIMPNIMKDHDFDEYTDFGISSYDKKKERETNDNYITNFNSKWNLFLTTIENEIYNMKETSYSERESSRSRKNKYQNYP